MVLSLFFFFQAFATCCYLKRAILFTFWYRSHPGNEVDGLCCKRCVSSDTIFIVKDFLFAYKTLQKKKKETHGRGACRAALTTFTILAEKSG